MQPIIRLTNYLEEYKRLTYDYYAKTHNIVYSTYYQLNPETTQYDPHYLATYHKTGEYSGRRYRKIHLMPLILTFIFFTFNYPPYFLYISWIIAGGFLGGGVSLYYSKKICGLKYYDFYKIVFIPSLFISLIMFAFGMIPKYLLDESIERFLLVCFMTTISFIISLFYMFLSKQELDWIQSLIVKLKNISYLK